MFDRRLDIDGAKPLLPQRDKVLALVSMGRWVFIVLADNIFYEGSFPRPVEEITRQRQQKDHHAETGQKNAQAPIRPSPPLYKKITADNDRRDHNRDQRPFEDCAQYLAIRHLPPIAVNDRSNQ